ncbi:MAG: hypothetical protein J1F28_04445, partial [Oscillospiraceae bacterium]|nr:hypothetical protein [Oscillospiraceae bacterium]
LVFPTPMDKKPQAFYPVRFKKRVSRLRRDHKGALCAFGAKRYFLKKVPFGNPQKLFVHLCGRRRYIVGGTKQPLRS